LKQTLSLYYSLYGRQNLAVSALSLEWQRIHKVLWQDSKMSPVNDDTSESKKSLVQRRTEH